MAIASTNGAQIFIGPVNNSALTKTVYSGLTYVEMKTIESISEFGDQAATITFTSLGDSRVRKRKGVRDGGDVNIVAAHDPLDTGQQNGITAQTTDFTYAFKVIVQDGADANDTDSVYYFRALVSSARLSITSANNMIKRNFSLLIDSPVLEVPSLVVSP